MTMIGEPMLLNPTVRIGPWDPLDDPTAALAAYFAHRSHGFSAAGDASDEDFPVAAGAFSCDRFRMFEFKVRACARGKSHDWTKCPYAHAGEKARRRDPRKFHYSGAECPEFRLGSCRKGDSCELAHGVFESWLHPDRYRTQPCRDGASCLRRVCFFAHSPEQLRSPTKPAKRSLSSPSSISPASDSPPMSPNSRSLAGEIVSLMHDLQLRSGFGSPRVSSLRPPVSSPTVVSGAFDLCEKAYEEEPAMERVESGRDLRAQMYAKLMRDNSQLSRSY